MKYKIYGILVSTQSKVQQFQDGLEFSGVGDLKEVSRWRLGVITAGCLQNAFLLVNVYIME